MKLNMIVQGISQNKDGYSVQFYCPLTGCSVNIHQKELTYKIDQVYTVEINVMEA